MALADAMAQQSRDVEASVLELRRAQERAERRVAELEAKNDVGESPA